MCTMTAVYDGRRTSLADIQVQVERIMLKINVLRNRGQLEAEEDEALALYLEELSIRLADALVAKENNILEGRGLADALSELAGMVKVLVSDVAVAALRSVSAKHNRENTMYRNGRVA